MEKYEFNILCWLNFTDSEAKLASAWYQGAGWYYNPIDEKGGKLHAQCVAKSEHANYHGGLCEALNECGAEGWSVAAFMPPPPKGTMGKLVERVGAILTLSSWIEEQPYIILQRRVVTKA